MGGVLVGLFVFLGCASDEPAASPAPVASAAPAAPTPRPPPEPVWGNADRVRMEDTVRRAEKDPSVVAELDTNPMPRAALWRRFFAAVAYGPPLPSGETPGDPTTTFAAMMDLYVEFDSPGPWPCWVAMRWPEAWLPWVYSDTIAADKMDYVCDNPLVDAPVQRAWIAQMNRALYRARGPLDFRCGTIQRSYDVEATAQMTALWYNPVGYGRTERPHVGGYMGGYGSVEAAAAGVVRTPVRPTSTAALVRSLAPSRAWFAYVERHLQHEHHVSGAVARAQSRRLAEGLTVLMLESHAACNTLAENVADGFDNGDYRGWAPYGVSGSEVIRPQGVFGLW